MEIDGHNIKMSEFMEKYWRVIDHTGKPMEVKLSESEKLLMDISEEMGLDAWVKTGGRRSSFKWIPNPKVVEEIERRKNEIA